MRLNHFLFVCFLSILPSLAMARAETKMATADGQSLAYQEFGQGETVIIMVSGLGDGKSSFAKIAPQLAKSARVIIYDRAGYEDSPLLPSAATLQRSRSELLLLIDNLGINDPVILVGHSLGGIYIHDFAQQYPQKVKALVFDDGRPPNFTQNCLIEIKSPCKLPKLLAMAFTGGAKQEIDNIDAIESDASRLSGSLIPSLILSRTPPKNIQARTFDGLWARQQTHWAVLYPNSNHFYAPKSGHYIHQDMPEWFLNHLIGFMAKIETGDKPN